MKQSKDITWADLGPSEKRRLEKELHCVTRLWRISGKSWWNMTPIRQNLNSLEKRAPHDSNAVSDLSPQVSYLMRNWCRSFIQLRLDITKRQRPLEVSLRDFLARNQYVVQTRKREMPVQHPKTLKEILQKGLVGSVDLVFLGFWRFVEKCCERRLMQQHD